MDNHSSMEKDIEISGQTLHYEESGPEHSRPVIIMHGWGCDHNTVKSIANSINDKLHVFNIDLPGFGKSPEPSSVWGVENYSDLISKFIEKLNLIDPILIGHSYGGRVAILLASKFPLSKILLVDAAGIKPKRPLSYYFKVYSFKAAKHSLPILFGKKLGNKLIEKWRGKAGSSDYQNASVMMKKIMSKSVNQDLTPLLSDIKAETLLIWGEKDTATPMRDAKIMENKIPNAGLVSFPNAGHYSFLDEPLWFKAVIREFFKSEINCKSDNY